jgi:hypothetical protein
MPQQLLPTIGTEWDLKDPAGAGFTRKRFLQTLSDVIARPVNNRVTISTNATAVVCNGGQQSTGVGTGPITPSVYGEHQVQARVSLKPNTAGIYYVFVYRTTGAIPAKGAAPNAGDVIVGSDAFGGGTIAAGVVTPATMSVIDSGLSSTTPYIYYFVVNGPNGDTLNLINGSQLMVSEF